MSSGNSRKLLCPECGGRMSFEGYRPLFPVCLDCGENFYYEECLEE
jgi:uncharacterized protein (DUF983 family)